MRDGDGDNKNPNMEPSKGSYMTSNAVENAVQSCRIPSKAPMLAHKKYRQGKVEEKRDHEKKTQAWREELIWSCKNGGNGVAGCTWQGFADWFCFCGRAFARLLDRDEHRSSAGGREAWGIDGEEGRFTTFILRGAGNIVLGREYRGSSGKVADARGVVVGGVGGAPEGQFWRCALAVIGHVNGATTRSQERTWVCKVVKVVKGRRSRTAIRFLGSGF